jgi:hypothetical protein
MSIISGPEHTFSRKLKGEFGFKDAQGTGADRRYYWKGHKLTDFTGTQEGQSTFSPHFVTQITRILNFLNFRPFYINTKRARTMSVERG